MIPVRVPVTAPTYVVGGERHLSPDHPLWDVACPVCDIPLGGGTITLVYVGTDPTDRKPAGWTTGGAVAVHADCVGAGAQREGDGHTYLSTACWHALNDSKPELHASCRNSCKYCDASCGCGVCHPESGTQPGRASWVDQARDLARMFYGLAPERLIDADLAERIATDPDLFWLRGEERPPGTWSPPSSGGSDA